MAKSKPLVLFDIDFTIFDTAQLRQNRYELLADKLGYSDLQEFYKLARQLEEKTKEQAGTFAPRVFLSLLIKETKKDISFEELLKDFFDESFYRKSVYEDSKEVIEKLIHNDVEVGVLSTGEPEFQHKKLHIFKELFPDEHIHIFADKLQHLEKILLKYNDRELYLVDDMPFVLADAKKIDPAIITVWINRDTKDLHSVLLDVRNEIAGFTPDITITDLRELLPSLDIS